MIAQGEFSIISRVGKKPIAWKYIDLSCKIPRQIDWGKNHTTEKSRFLWYCLRELCGGAWTRG